MSPIFSPTLSASSPSHTDISQSVPDLVDDKALDFFNFDQYDSATSSHSPVTASANNTPSPLLAAQSPFALSFSPNYAVNEFDFDFDSMFEKAPLAPAVASSGPSDVVQIKQEPMEFTFDLNTSSNTALPPITEAQVPPPASAAMNPLALASTLPPDQQRALQELMNNIQRYQQSFPTALASAPAQQTIEPSLLFGTSPSTSTAFSTSASTSAHISPVAIAQPASTQQAAEASHLDDETLVALQHDEQPIAGPSRPRQGSTFSSADDIDSKIERLAPLQAIFSAGRGKGGKKGGGMSSVVRMEDEDLDDDDSWRPSPEEYKKLSSKEKRQLRNKLSARAFRTRRKDYIGTLEGHIKDRDSVIDEIKTELIHSRMENQDLRRELAALKASTMSILHPESATSSAPSPALISALAMPATLPTPAPIAKRTPAPAPTPTFNPRKDLPSSSTEASRGFWGNDNNMFGGGSTICHHLFTPDLVLPTNTPHPINLPRVNLNPMLNDADSRGPSLAATANGLELNPTFSEWSEANPFSLRSMDSYRMQLWSRLAREATAEKDKLAPEMRPKFYVEAKSPSTSSTSSSTATAEASLSPANADILAQVATQHITSKLASSFWSAFSTPGASSSKLDTDKLTAVVTGTARLKVVAAGRDLEAISEKSSSALDAQDRDKKRNLDDAEALAAAMGGLKLQSGLGMVMGMGMGMTTGMSKMESMTVRENPLGALSSFLKHASGVPARA